MTLLKFEYNYVSSEGPISGTTTVSSENLEESILNIKENILKYSPEAQDIQIKESLKNEGHAFLVDQLIDLILEKRPDLSREELNKSEYIILKTNRDSYSRGAFALTLPEAKAFMAKKGRHYDDFVYLRNFSLVLFNIGLHTSHEIFTSNWHWIEKHLMTNPNLSLKDYRKDPQLREYKVQQEVFLHDQCGFFMSRAFNLRQVLKSADMRLSAIEKTVFGHMDFDEIEPPKRRERD